MRRRILLAQFLPLAPVALVGLVSVLGLMRMTTVIGELRAQELHQIQTIGTAMDLVREEISLLERMVESPDATGLERAVLRAAARERSAQVHDLLAQLPADLVPITQWLDGYEALAGIAGGEPQPGAEEAGGELLKVMQVHHDHLTYSLEVELAAMANTGRLIGMGIMASVLLLLLTGLGLAWLMARSLVLELDTLEAGTRALARGDFEHRIEIDRDDEFGRLAQAFNHMTNQIGALDRMKIDFFANISHDLKTPLTSLLEGVALLKEEIAGPLNTDQHALVEVLDESSTRLKALVHNVLDLSRLNATASARTLGDASLLVDGMLGEVRLLAERRSLELVRTGARGPTPVLVNRGMLEQVLMNLLDNAIKFSPEGARVVVDLRVEDGRVRVGVRDEGPGIPLEHRERVFGRFYQLPDQREQSGSGLGLHICRQIIDAHDGEIGVICPPEGGTELWFTLPPGRPPRPSVS